MQNAIGRLEFPELFFGIVAPVGADTEPTIRAIEKYARETGYRVVPIKVTDYFSNIAKTIKPNEDLKKHPTDQRITSYTPAQQS